MISGTTVPVRMTLRLFRAVGKRNSLKHDRYQKQNFAAGMVIKGLG